MAQAIKKDIGGHIARDRLRLEPCERCQEAVHILQTGHTVRIEAQFGDALQKFVRRIALPAILDAGVKLSPGFVVLLRVKFVGLLNIEFALAPRDLNKGGFGRC